MKYSKLDPYAKGSPTNQTRSRRMRFFTERMEKVARPVEILDVGGREDFWVSLDLANMEGVTFTLMNLEIFEPRLPNMKYITGNACKMPQYADKSWEVVFSNSVIEHVGTFEDQCAMAREIMRVSKRYFIQTPNRYFPIEPHALFPLFQFLPISLRIWLVTNKRIGPLGPTHDRAKAEAWVREMRLMTAAELRKAFPGATILHEKYKGLTKSFMVVGGWND